MRFRVLPVLASALLIGLVLNVLRKSSKQAGMAGGDTVAAECLGDGRNELQECKAGVDVACALACLLDQRGDIVTGHVEETLEALRLFIRAHVLAKCVFDQLPFKSLGVGDIDDAGGKREDFRKERGAEASCACHDLEALRVGRTVMGWMRPLVRMLSALCSASGYVAAAAGSRMAGGGARSEGHITDAPWRMMMLHRIFPNGECHARTLFRQTFNAGPNSR